MLQCVALQNGMYPCEESSRKRKIRMAGAAAPALGRESAVAKLIRF